MIKRALLLALLCSPLAQPAGAADWYNSLWGHRKAVPVNGAAVNQTNYQLKITVAFIAGKMNSDFSDVRFTGSDGATPLAHWRETYTASVTADFWVKVPSIPVAGTTLYLYYGNTAAATASNATSTYLLFDDFSGDFSKWVQYVSGNADIIMDAGRARLRVYRCAYSNLTSTFTVDSNNMVSFDWWRQTDNWCESAYVQLLLNGVPQPSTGFGGCQGYSGSGHIDEPTVIVAAASTETVKLAVDASGPCGNGDHGNTYLWIDNVRVRNYISPEPAVGAFGAEENSTAGAFFSLFE